MKRRVLKKRASKVKQLEKKLAKKLPAPLPPKKAEPVKVNLKEYVGKLNIFLPVRLASKTLPDIRRYPESQPDSYNNGVVFRGKTLTHDCIIITDVYAYGATYSRVYYFVEGSTVKSEFMIMHNADMTLLEGEDLEKIMPSWKKFSLTNLQNTLGHACHIGADPEIFAGDADGMVIPAFEYLPGKDKPVKTDDVANGKNNVYWDGFQAEFTTTVVTCLGWQVDSVQLGLKKVLQEAKKYDKKAILLPQTVVDVPLQMLMDGKNEHIEFGCMPSLNAYGVKPYLASGREVPFRPAGGHIHFGIGKTTEKDAIPIVKALDAVLGVACVSLFAKFDDPRRRTIYGLAGEYRLPNHGLEYRVLSNAWLFHPMIMNLIFDIARKAMMLGKTGQLNCWETTDEETMSIINRCDVDGARRILTRNKEVMLSIIKAAYHPSSYGADSAQMAFNVFMSGMEKVIKNPNDIAGNWNLEGQWTTHSDGREKNFIHSVQANNGLTVGIGEVKIPKGEIKFVPEVKEKSVKLSKTG